jgi:hypothetical protein
MYTYNWYHSDVQLFIMYTNTDYNIHGTIPLLLSPFGDSLLLPFLIPFTYLETLLAVTGSVHPGLRLLVN